MWGVEHELSRTESQLTIDLTTLGAQGKPLAYTPFCDNNRAMDGFRFWKQGFWKDHLAGRPYHISALYVVDLARFRQASISTPSCAMMSSG